MDSISEQNTPAVQCSDNVSVNMSSNVHASIAVNSSLCIPTNTETPGSNAFTDIPADAPVEDNVIDQSLTAHALTSCEYKKNIIIHLFHVPGRGYSMHTLSWILRKWLTIKSC